MVPTVQTVRKSDLERARNQLKTIEAYFSTNLDAAGSLEPAAIEPDRPAAIEPARLLLKNRPDRASSSPFPFKLHGRPPPRLLAPPHPPPRLRAPPLPCTAAAAPRHRSPAPASHQADGNQPWPTAMVSKPNASVLHPPLLPPATSPPSPPTPTTAAVPISLRPANPHNRWPRAPHRARHELLRPPALHRAPTPPPPSAAPPLRPTRHRSTAPHRLAPAHLGGPNRANRGGRRGAAAILVHRRRKQTDGPDSSKPGSTARSSPNLIRKIQRIAHPMSARSNGPSSFDRTVDFKSGIFTYFIYLF